MASDKFAKAIGLVARDFIMWEYQQNPAGGVGYTAGFGIKMWMIDHN